MAKLINSSKLTGDQQQKYIEFYNFHMFDQIFIFSFTYIAPSEKVQVAGTKASSSRCYLQKMQEAKL